MNKSKRLSHVHARSYWGEWDSVPLINWLTRKDRPQGDPVERIVLLHQGISPLRDRRADIITLIAKTVRTWHFALVPVAGSTPEGWTVDWRHTGRVAPAQALAFIKVLHLANQQLLHRIRKCGQCGSWFFARMIHKEFCSSRCQQLHIRSSEKWKQGRRDYMRRLRREKKLRELRENKRLALSKTKKGAIQR